MPWPERVIGRHRLILVAWTVAALLLALQAQAFSSHINYSFDPFIPQGLEAKKAQELASSLFGLNNTDEEFIVIKAEAGYVNSSAGLRLLEELDANISAAGLKGLLGVRSLASVFQQVNSSYWSFVNKTLSSMREGLKQNVSLLHEQLFSLYGQLSQLHDALFLLAQAVNASSSLVYGLPTAYVQAWLEAARELNQSMPGQPMPAATVNELAFRQVNSSLALSGDSLSRSYLYAFYVSWNASFSSPYILPQDLQLSEALSRAQSAVDRAMPALLSSPGLGEKAKALRLAWSAMNITQWQLPSLRYELSLEASVDAISAQQGVEKGVLEQLKALGPSPPEPSLQNLTIALFSSRSGLESGLLREIMALGPQPSPSALGQLVDGLLDKLRQGLLERYPPPSYPNGIPRELFKLLADPTNSTTLVLVSFEGNLSRDDAYGNVRALRALVQGTLRNHSSTAPLAYVTGGSSFGLDVSELDARDVPNIDRVTVLAVLLLLMGLLASAVAPLLPLALIGSALVMGLGVLTLLAEQGFKIFYLVRSTISVVTLGAGIDYVVYMLFRYLEEREFGATPYEATLRTTKYAGETVATSALAVMVGFGSLVSSRVGVLQSVGLSLALGVLFALIAALLLVPSLLVLLKDRILWPRRRLPSFAYRLQLFRAIAALAIGRRRQVLALGIALTVLLGLAAMTMNRTYNDLDMVPPLESKQGFQLILEGFGAERLSPSYAVVLSNVSLFTSDRINLDVFRALDTVCSAIKSTPGVAPDSVRCPTRPEGAEVQPNGLDYNKSSAYIGKDGRSYLFTFGLTSFYSSQEAFEGVQRVRASISSAIAANPPLAGSRSYVGGPAAFYLDLSTAINQDYLWPIIPVAFAGIFVVLLIVLRSAVIPLLFLATTLMSTVWTLGLMALIFQHLLRVDIYWLVPIMLFTVLIGLGMDYNVFLITRVREGVLQGLSDEEAAARAVERTALVLTAAGLIMAAAFGSLIVSSSYILKQTGFALSVGILLDTSIVRLLMSPAIIASAKRWNWWPSRPSSSPRR